MFVDSKNRTRATGVMHALPAVTAFSGNNIAVRLFKYNLTTFDLVDSITFYCNLTAANKKGVMTFEFGYSAKDLYRIKDMSPQSWHNIWRQMHDPSSPAWKGFASLFATNVGRVECGSQVDKSCHKYHICSMGNMDYENYSKCLNNPL